MTGRTEDTDVLVIGGGTAGFGAAVAAGRKGLRVTLLEATSKVGGVMAFCPGMPWGGGYPVDRIIGGLLEELTARLEAMDPPAAEKRPCTLDNFGPEIIYDHDIATLTMFEMLEEAGVRTRLNATAIAPDMQNGRIDNVACFDRSGPFVVRPQIVIDCSGDGDISAKAGVPFVLGDARGNMMAVTISFHMVGVDWEAAFADPDPYRRGSVAPRFGPIVSDERVPYGNRVLQFGSCARGGWNGSGCSGYSHTGRSQAVLPIGQIPAKRCAGICQRVYGAIVANRWRARNAQVAGNVPRYRRGFGAWNQISRWDRQLRQSN
jgi:hypothetical protein